MLLELGVNNYQSLRSVRLVLGRVTVIVGHSDAGKTALLRAIQALCFNQEGSSFIHRALDKNGDLRIHEPAEVAVKLDTGHLLLWRRFESTHAYVLFQPNGEKTVFTKTGGTVPSEIQDLLLIRPVTVEERKKEKVHFAFQHELPFLVGDRGGVATSRVLGRLTGLHVFANAAKQCTGAKDQLNARLLQAKEKRDRWRVRLEPFSILQAATAQFEQTQNHSTLITQREQQAKELRECSLRYEGLLGRRRILQQFEAVSVEPLRIRLGAMKELYERTVTLRGFRVKLLDGLQRRKRFQAQIRAQLPNLPSTERYEQLRQLRTLADRVKTLSLQYQTQRTQFEKTTSELSQLEGTVKELQVQLKLCAACGRPL